MRTRILTSALAATTLLLSLSGCAWWHRMTGASSAPATQSSDAAPAPMRAIAATPAINATPTFVGAYAFEAERVAKGQGCEGPGGVRPSATLKQHDGGAELYEVACSTKVVRVQCDTGMCHVAR